MPKHLVLTDQFKIRMIEKKLSQENSSHLGVSSIIGVILMIALTILLATVVGTYAFNLADDVLSQPAQAGVSFDQEYNQFNDVYIVTAVLNTAPNVQYVDLRGDTIDNGDGDYGECSSALDAAGYGNSPKPQVEDVGSSAHVCVSGSGGEVRAVGVTSDGEQVITSHSISPQN